MSLFDNPNSIKLLENLLKPPGENSDTSDDEGGYIPAKNPSAITPGTIGEKSSKKGPSKPSPYTKIEESETKSNPKGEEEIEKWLEKQQQQDCEILDSRKCPEFKIAYKQAVGTEDVFLQMNNKTAATMSCEDMVIEISVPDETIGIEQMNLSITETEVDFRSPQYRLKLPLAQKINPDKGRAEFDPDTKTLKLTLRMEREFDFINF